MLNQWPPQTGWMNGTVVMAGWSACAPVAGLAMRRAPQSSAVTSHPPEEPMEMWPRMATSEVRTVADSLSARDQTLALALPSSFSLSSFSLGRISHGVPCFKWCPNAPQTEAKARRVREARRRRISGIRSDGSESSEPQRRVLNPQSCRAGSKAVLATAGCPGWWTRPPASSRATQHGSSARCSASASPRRHRPISAAAVVASVTSFTMDSARPSSKTEPVSARPPHHRSGGCPSPQSSGASISPFTFDSSPLPLRSGGRQGAAQLPCSVAPHAAARRGHRPAGTRRASSPSSPPSVPTRSRMVSSVAKERLRQLGGTVVPAQGPLRQQRFCLGKQFSGGELYF